MMSLLTGSAIVSIELAEYLKSQKAEVTIYTCFKGEPVASLCEKKNISVVSFEEKPQFKLGDFDIIWIHSQILPLSIVEQLGEKLPKKMPIFVFLHMSGMDWIPDEKPWIHDLENRLSSLSLFISEEVRSLSDFMLSDRVKRDYFRNPAPTAYIERSKPPRKELRSVLFVSNHPPEEVLEAKKILSEKGIETATLGYGQDFYEMTSPKLINRYDAVVAIGKTVQYGLVSGTPVYVYDGYGGGPGWLNESNFKTSSTRNFSGYQNKQYPSYVGDGFHPKTAPEIASEILEGYRDAREFAQEKKDSFLEDYLIDNVLERLLLTIQKRSDIEKFDDSYTAMLYASELFATNHFVDISNLWLRDQAIIERDSLTIPELRKRIEVLKEENDKLRTDLDYLKRFVSTRTELSVRKFVNKLRKR